MFPYWWEFGRFYKKENGIYVPDDELVRLALIKFEERRTTNPYFDLFVDVRKYGWEGVFRISSEKWKIKEEKLKNIPEKGSISGKRKQVQQLKLIE